MKSPLMLAVGTRYETWLPAGEVDVPSKGTFSEKFASGAFDRSIGKVIPFKLGDRQVGHVRVVAAKVADDGSGVTFTYEIIDLDTN